MSADNEPDDEVTTPVNGHITDEVPAVVLDELSAAFAEPVEPTYDFDDPNIDRLLGIGPVEADAVADVAVDEPVAEEPVEPVDASPVRKVIVIEETDRPDAVYLDEEGEQRLRDVHGGDGSRSTIVISDLDEGIRTEQPPSRTPSMDPRVRDRRAAVDKAKSRRRLVWAAVALGAVIVLVGVLTLLGSTLFDVEKINVQGASYSAAAIQPTLDEVLGKPVLLVDTGDLEQKLEASPWVERAKVSTDFPHAISVDIRERVPLAYFVGADGGVRVIDRDGRVLDILSGGVPSELIQLTGNHADAPTGTFAGALYGNAATLAKGLPPEIRNLLTSIDVDSANNELALQLRAEGEQQAITARLGQPTDLTTKMARLLQLLRSGLEPSTTVVDVSTAEVSER